MSLSKAAYQAIYDGLLKEGEKPDAKEIVTSDISEKFGGNPRSIELSLLFFERCISGRPHRLGLPMAIVEVALDKAVESENPQVLQNTVFCIEDYLQWAQERKSSSNPGIRSILSGFRKNFRSDVTTISQAQYESAERQNAADAMRLSDAELAKRARDAERGPRPTKPVVGERRQRNPFVREYVLRQAKGRCQHCGKTAPFNHKVTKMPFLEVHHLIPLAEGGDDTVENARALCPNCHREAHHGENWMEYRN